MKLLIFSSYWKPYCSGALTLVHRLAEHWATQGHGVRVITFRYDARLSLHEIDHGVEIIRLRGFWRISKGFIAPLLLLRVWSSMRWCDGLVLNLPAFEGFRPALAAWLMRRPIIALVNCTVALGPSLLERLITGALTLSIRAQLALATRIVTWSEDYAAACPLLRGRGNKLTTILPGLAPPACDEAMRQRLQAIIGKRRAVAFVGRISREKGLEVLIAALEHLRDTELILILAGPHGAAVIGEEATQRRIETVLERSNTPHLRLGFLTHAELGALYRSVDLLALPSLNSTESLGLVQAEALQLGARVVASDLPGVRLPVRLTELGSLARPGDEASLAQAIRRELANPRTTTEERQRAASIFQEQRMFEEWDRLVAAEQHAPDFGCTRETAQYLERKPLFYAPLRPLEVELVRHGLQNLQVPRMDFGCGDGFFAAQLAPALFFDYGVDIDPRLAPACAGIYGKFVTWDGQRLPFEDQSLGSIVCNSVMEHTRNPERILAEWHRVLRPGGRVACTITLQGWDQALPSMLRGLCRMIQRHHTLWNIEAWGAAFAQAGFTLKLIQPYGSPAGVRRIMMLHLPAFPLWYARRLLGIRRLQAALGRRLEPFDSETSAEPRNAPCALLIFTK